jgi:hypothetical protein
MPLIVIDETLFRALLAGRTVKLRGAIASPGEGRGNEIDLILDKIDRQRLIDAVVNTKPPDPPQAREFLSRPRRK